MGEGCDWKGRLACGCFNLVNVILAACMLNTSIYVKCIANHIRDGSFTHIYAHINNHILKHSIANFKRVEEGVGDGGDGGGRL